MKGIIRIGLLLIIGILAGMCNAFWFQKSYNFIVPVVYNLPELRYIESYGLCVILSLIMIGLHKSEDDDAPISDLVTKSLVYLVTGGILTFNVYIISLFL